MKTAPAIVLVGLILALGGCTANRPFRTNFKPFDPNAPDHGKAVIVSASNYKLGFVEFDDQGWFWDLRQRAAVEQMIRSEAGIGTGAATNPATNPATKPSPQGIILVAFVHGWKDNAADDSDGVNAFGSILDQLSKAEAAQKDHAARKVVGVYAGWRGLSATWEPFRELSFWERKDTAHKVGGYGAMTELLVDLENIQQQSLDSLPPNAPRTELIIIGHSFGGAAVYSALSQIITERFVATLANGKRLKPLGDQVILLNPAFEAVRHYDLNQMAVSLRAYPPDQRPVLSIFTSRGDWATHYIFPIGRFFATIFQGNRDHQQALSGWDTVGWFPAFVTHDLVYTVNPAAPVSATSTFNPATQSHQLHGRSELKKSVENVQAQRSKWHPNGPAAQTYYFDDAALKPRDGYRPGDPFLVVSVDNQIMHGHSDITNPVLINFIREYIQFCQNEVVDHSK